MNGRLTLDISRVGLVLDVQIDRVAARVTALRDLHARAALHAAGSRVTRERVVTVALVHYARERHGVGRLGDGVGGFADGVAGVQRHQERVGVYWSWWEG